jgi:hypothetical protein
LMPYRSERCIAPVRRTRWSGPPLDCYPQPGAE